MTGWTLAGFAARVGGFRLGPVELELPDGTALAVVGPSGAGKTTLLRAWAGVVPNVDGAVTHGSTDFTRTPPERRRTVYVPQGLGLFPHRTVRQNVSFPLDLLGGKPDPSGTTELLRRFGLDRWADRRPTTLSNGEQQRVAIARALSARPDLLLWDEPLTGLDLLARDDLVEALRNVREHDSLSVVLVTHDPAIAFSLADRILVLDAGRVRFLGTPDRLVERPPTRFAARFVGYENVFASTDLDVPGGSALVRWLRERCGAEGLGFPAVEITPDGAWSATVQGVEPGPVEFRYRVEADGVRVRLRGAARAPNRLGDRVRFSIDERDIASLAGAAEAR